MKKNYLANKSELYIFSDAPQCGDEEIVQKVRNYLDTIDGFRKVYIIKRKKNSRVFNNRDGMRQLLTKHKKMIWLEDDIETSPNFLKFMNAALDFYKDNKKVINISGYMPPINIQKDYKKDYISIQRFNGWGYGIWKDRFDKINLYLDENQYKKNIQDKVFFKKLNSNGEDIPVFLEFEIEKKIDALDVKIMYQQIVNDWYTICPTYSLVQNIGHDGSGAHCGVSNKFNHINLWKKKNNFVFSNDLTVNLEIQKEFRRVFKLNKKEKIIKFLKYIKIFPLIKFIKDKVVRNAN